MGAAMKNGSKWRHVEENGKRRDNKMPNWAIETSIFLAFALLVILVTLLALHRIGGL
jgi:hypothetical protein